MIKRSKCSVEQDGYNRQIGWELRPGGMLVQKRDIGDASSGPMIKIKVSHDSYYHDVIVHSRSTFGNHLINYFLAYCYFPHNCRHLLNFGFY